VVAASSRQRRPGQAPTFEDVRIRIGEGEAEDVLGEVDGDGGDDGGFGRSMHNKNSAPVRTPRNF
jgi:hypothetical protein